MGLLASGVFSADMSRHATAEEIGARKPATDASFSAAGKASPNVEASTESVLVPEQLELKADRQFYDTKRKITIAEGNVTARLGEVQLQADRIEFDTAFRTLFARGSVRLHRGNQFFQASILRYNFVQNEGELHDVYGVIDLEGTPVALPKPANERTLGPSSTGQSSQSTEGEPRSSVEADTSMACPPFLPPVPDWHPQAWAITVWGRDLAGHDLATMPPPDGCPDPDRDQRIHPSSLSEHLEAISIGDESQHRLQVPPASSTEPPAISPAEQQALRTAAIKKIDQRVTDIDLTGNFSIEPQGGVPMNRRNSSVQDKYRFGLKVPQLKRVGRTKLQSGTISTWRIQANRIRITANGWQSDRMGFSNDPFTPSQFRIDAEGVIAKEQPNGDLLISARRNRLIIDERLSIQDPNPQLVIKDKSRWVFGINNEDRGGFFIGRTLQPITIGNSTELSLEPQVLVQRAASDRNENLGDIFGLKAILTSRFGDYRLNSEVDISSFNGDSFLDNSRYWVDLGRKVDLGFLGEAKMQLFSTYRHRTWNGSLGETDIQAAYGIYGEKNGEWSQGDIRHLYLLRGAIGNYYADWFEKQGMLRSGRGSLFASLTSNFPLWKRNSAELTPTQAYRYSPVAIIPGISLSTNINSSVAMYSEGTQQSSLSFSLGPTITLGTFSKPFLDFTQISVIGGSTLKNGESPFEFDRIVDLRTLGAGITQQIVGPLIFSAGIDLNVDPNSVNYGEVIDSKYELRWQRRSYDVGLYYIPNEGIGGIRFRLNNFNFKGTGIPFVPYTPTDWLNRNSKSQQY